MKRAILLASVLALAALATLPGAQAKVLNSNTDDLPPGCSEISEEIDITVRGGIQFAQNFTGVAFTFDKHSWSIPTCALVTMTFINTDEIRHQFMPHGTWPEGFTLIEVDGPGQDTASFIAPANPTTIMVHCGVNQHQQKGMKAQFVVGGGEGDVPNIPGVSGLPDEDRAPDLYGTPTEQPATEESRIPAPPAGLVALLAALAGLALARRGR